MKYIISEGTRRESEYHGVLRSSVNFQSPCKNQTPFSGPRPTVYLLRYRKVRRVLRIVIAVF